MDIRSLFGRDVRELTTEELYAVIEAESRGTAFPGELPISDQLDREKSLDSPSYLATKVLDSWYERHFERLHYSLMDEVLGPWLLGETVRIEGVNYDPLQYTGLVVLQSRGTIKSTILRMMFLWESLHRKLRRGEDARTMFVHKVLEKAVEHSEAIRATARQHVRWRACFPEFAAPADREWDTKSKWRWPCFATYLATEWSFTCYGETSSKEGGHYTSRLIDDWVTEDSATTPGMLEQSFERFRKMDNLRDRSREWNPWIAMGTNYHYQDTYQRLEDQGGWLVWRVPGHTGSPKRIFELCSVDDRTKEGRREIERGLRALESDPPGELHFPKMLPWRELYRTARQTGPSTYNCQIQLNPMPEGEQRFDHEALDAALVTEHPGPEGMWLYVRCDPAISMRRDADETAYIVGGVEWNGRRWVLDGWIGREKRPTALVRTGFDLARKWQGKGFVVKSIGYESVQYQEALAELARNGVPEREASHHGESVPVQMRPCAVVSIERSSDMTKHERIISMEGAVSRGDLRIYARSPVARKVLAQFKNYPFDRYDALDATHDLWIKTQTPPRPQRERELPFHPELMHLIREPGEEPELCGTRAVVSLYTWGRA